MRKIVSKFSTYRAFWLIVIILNFDCTGFNIAEPNLTTSTNPTPEYAILKGFGRGGYFFHNNSIPGQLGNNVGEKLATGESCSRSALWLFSWGDSSIESAKMNGSIKRISSVEYKQLAIFGFIYHRFCTKVIGSIE